MAKSNGSASILSGKQADGDYVEQLSGISGVLNYNVSKGAYCANDLKAWLHQRRFRVWRFVQALIFFFPKNGTILIIFSY